MSAETSRRAQKSSAWTRHRMTRSFNEVGRSRYRRNRFPTAWAEMAWVATALQLLGEVAGHAEIGSPGQPEQDDASQGDGPQEQREPAQADRRQRVADLTSRRRVRDGTRHPVQSPLEAEHDGGHRVRQIEQLEHGMASERLPHQA